MSQRVWRHSGDVPRISGCENVEQYDGTFIRDEIQRLRSANAPGQLREAGAGWRATSEKLRSVQQTVGRAAGMLAGAWTADDATLVQQQLKRLHDSAAELARNSSEVYSFAESAANSLQHAIETFPEDGPGGWQTGGQIVGGNLAGPLGIIAGGRVGEAIDNFVNDPNEKPRQALAELNGRYQSDNTRLPSQISVELPNISRDFRGAGALPASTLSPTAPPTAGAVSGAASAGAFTPTSVSSAPSPGAVGPGGGGGASGIISGAIPAGPVAGSGAETGAGTGGLTGGLAGASGATSPGPSGLPGGVTGGGATSPSAGLGAGLGLGAAGAAAGAGAVGFGRTGAVGLGPGRAGAAPGGGGVAGGRAGGIGRSAAGRPGIAGGVGGPAAGRPGIAGGLVPLGGGGAAGSGAAGGGAAGGGAGRGGGAPGTPTGAPPGGGRAGGAGGMVPMSTGGRGAGDEDERETWLMEDGDPWAADRDVPPGVIR